MTTNERQADLFAAPPARPPARLDMDAQRGQRRKVAGQDAAAEGRAGLLALARSFAKRCARQGGRVTADDVQAALIAGGHDPAELGNAAGSIFRGAEWKCIGHEPSRRAGNNARTLKVWALR